MRPVSLAKRWRVEQAGQRNEKRKGAKQRDKERKTERERESRKQGMIGGSKGRRSAKIVVIGLSSVGQLTGKWMQRNVYTRERAHVARGKFLRAYPPGVASLRDVYTCERVARDKETSG